VEEHRRVGVWFYSVVIHHAAEHSFFASRFLTLDWLKNDWAEYLENFKSLAPEKRQAFLEKQGFALFRDIVAHIVAWWDQSRKVIEGVAADPAYKHPSIDVDSFNAEVVERYGKIDEAQLHQEFESSRLALIALVESLPDAILNHPEVQDWLKSDVIGHYFDHQM